MVELKKYANKEITIVGNGEKITIELLEKVVGKSFWEDKIKAEMLLQEYFINNHQIENDDKYFYIFLKFEEEIYIQRINPELLNHSEERDRNLIEYAAKNITDQIIVDIEKNPEKFKQRKKIEK